MYDPNSAGPSGNFRPRESRDSGPGTGDGVWFLDDDPSLLKALGRLLKSAGFRAEGFSEPFAFLARLERVPCRVAILDVWMPGMNGLKVQERIREISPTTRVIFISARNETTVRDSALGAGAIAFLVKPFEDEVLLQLVRSVVAEGAEKTDFGNG